MVVFTNHFKGSGESSLQMFKIALKPWIPLCKIIICKDEDDDQPLNMFGTVFKLRKTGQIFKEKKIKTKKEKKKGDHATRTKVAPPQASPIGGGRGKGMPVP